MPTTIFHLSDWHQIAGGFKRQLEWELRNLAAAAEAKGKKLAEPDLIILTGDMVMNFRPSLKDLGNEAAMQRGHYEQMIDTLDSFWPGVDIFAVRGNHDWCDYHIDGSVNAFDDLAGRTYEWKGLKIHGFRGVPPFHGFWKDEYPERQLAMLCDLVPQDTDILITHCPPYGILDRTTGDKNIGSHAILDLVNRLPVLKAHFFGHNHEQGGLKGKGFEAKGHKVFSNAACTLNKVVLY